MTLPHWFVTLDFFFNFSSLNVESDASFDAVEQIGDVDSNDNVNRQGPLQDTPQEKSSTPR